MLWIKVLIKSICDDKSWFQMDETEPSASIPLSELFNEDDAIGFGAIGFWLDSLIWFSFDSFLVETISLALLNATFKPCLFAAFNFVETCITLILLR